MNSADLASRLRGQFLTPRQRNSNWDLAVFVLAGFAHAWCGILMADLFPALTSAAYSQAASKFSGGLFWYPLISGICWMLLPVLLRVAKVVLPELAILALQVSAGCSAFAMLSLALSV